MASPPGVVGGGVKVPGGEVPGSEVSGSEVPGLSVPCNSRAAMITAITPQMTAPMIHHLHHLCPAVGDQGMNYYQHLPHQTNPHASIYCTQ